MVQPRTTPEEHVAEYRAKKRSEWRREVTIQSVVVAGGLLLIFLFRDSPWWHEEVSPKWIFGPAVALFVGLGVADLRRQLSARHWPRITCTIEFTLVEPFRRGTSLPVVGFSYSWRGVEYVGTELRASMAGVSRDTAAAAIAPYSPGQQHHCSVNPRKPSEAVLDVAFSPHAPVVLVAVGALCGLLWLGMAVGWIGG